MQKALLTVVSEGTGGKAAIDRYNVAGKTGTAENRGHDHSVFMGFAPMSAPKIAISVYIENGGFGAEFAVPAGALMIEQYLCGHLSEASERKAEQFANRFISYDGKRY